MHPGPREVIEACRFGNKLSPIAAPQLTALQHATLQIAALRLTTLQPCSFAARSHAACKVAGRVRDLLGCGAGQTSLKQAGCHSGGWWVLAGYSRAGSRHSASGRDCIIGHCGHFEASYLAGEPFDAAWVSDRFFKCLAQGFVFKTAVRSGPRALHFRPD